MLGVGREGASTQHPPPPEPRPFRIDNRSGTGPFTGSHKDVFLVLPAAPTVGEVRAAVAHLLNRKPEETDIGRKVGVCGGVRVVPAKNGRVTIFTSEDGRLTGLWKDVKDKKNEILTDDTASFFLPPGRRLVLSVRKR